MLRLRRTDRIPAEREMTDLLTLAAKHVPPAQIWVNPDCGLKTRKWDEVRPALAELRRQTGAGRHAAGFLSYEAGYALDQALSGCASTGRPSR